MDNILRNNKMYELYNLHNYFHYLLVRINSNGLSEI